MCLISLVPAVCLCISTMLVLLSVVLAVCVCVLHVQYSV